MANHYLGSHTIDAHMSNARDSPELLQGLSYTLATITTITNQVGETYSTLNDRHGIGTSCWGTGHLMLPATVAADARCAILR